MTITNPNESHLNLLRDGDTVRVNGQRTAYKVEGERTPYSAILIGPRGGVAYLVPSTDGKAVQISKGLGTSNKRDWIRTLEIEKAVQS